MNFVPAVAYLYCLALPTASTQPKAHFFAEPCIDSVYAGCRFLIDLCAICVRNGLVTEVGCLVVPVAGHGFVFLPAEARSDAIAVGLVSLVLKTAPGLPGPKI